MIGAPLIAPRLLLREMQADDWRFVQTLQTESDSKTPTEVRRTEQAAREFVRRTMAQQVEQPRTTYRFVIVLRAAQQPIGWCDLYLRAADAREAEIGFRVDARTGDVAMPRKQPARWSRLHVTGSVCSACGVNVRRIITRPAASCKRSGGMHADPRRMSVTAATCRCTLLAVLSARRSCPVGTARSRRHPPAGSSATVAA